MKRIISAVTVLAITLLFVGCYMQTAVTFNMDFIVDGEVYATVKTDKSSIEMPDDPVKDDYKFDGWFWDKDIWEKPLTLNSLIDAPLSQTLQVYAKFIKNEQLIPANFYDLQEAHNKDFITREDLRHISYFMTGEVWEYTIDCAGGAVSTNKLDFIPQTDTPALADLDTKIINDMKNTFYEINKQSIDDDLKWLKDNGYAQQYSTALDTISIVSFLGEYDDFYAVRITSSLWAYGEGSYTVNIAYDTGTTGGFGICWEMFYSPILIFAYDSNFNKPQYIRTDYCYNSDGVQREIVIESREQLDEYNTCMIQACVNSFNPFIRATKRYDAAFFKNNLLVLVVLAEGSGGNRNEITDIEYNRYNTIINIRPSASGETCDMAEWHIVVPLRRADIKSNYFIVSFPINPPVIDNGLSRTEKTTKLVGAFRSMNNFAGAWVNYIDSVEYLNVGLAVSQAEIDRLNATSNYGGLVIYHRQNFTYSYLKKIMNLLSTAMGDYTIYGMGINESENRIETYLNDEDKIELIISFLQENELYSIAAIEFNVDPNGGIIYC